MIPIINQEMKKLDHSITTFITQLLYTFNAHTFTVYNVFCYKHHCFLGGLQAIAELIQLDHDSYGNTADQYSLTLRRYAGMQVFLTLSNIYTLLPLPCLHKKKVNLINEHPCIKNNANINNGLKRSVATCIQPYDEWTVIYHCSECLGKIE